MGKDRQKRGLLVVGLSLVGATLMSFNLQLTAWFPSISKYWFMGFGAVLLILSMVIIILEFMK